MGIRVVKTALATVLAIYTAIYFGLEPPLSAGILAILGIEVTRIKGLRSVFARFTASMLGLFLASAIFSVLGFEIWALSLFILLVFPVLVKLKLKDGIITSAVIVFHLFSVGEVSGSLFLNEALLLLTGLGWATIVNMIYMPREDKKLLQLKGRIEQLFGEIYQELAMTLREPTRVWSGGQFLDAEHVLEDGIELSVRSKENRFWHGQAYWVTYFDMRRRQYETIQHMASIIAFVYERLPQGDLLADMFDSLSEDIKSEVYTGNAERRLKELEQLFRGMELPRSREEFEVRAALLQLCRELERYLSYAKRWKKQKLSDDLEIK